jgi:hypothetical protein
VHNSPFSPLTPPKDSSALLRHVNTNWSQTNDTQPQLAFQSLLGRSTATPHGARTLADDGADSSFISAKFLKQTKAVQLIPLATPIRCSGYNGQPAETITHRVEFYLRINSHLEHTNAFVLNSCGKFDLILGFKWRAIHDPHISWRNRTVTFSDKFCARHCNQSSDLPTVLCEGSTALTSTSKPGSSKPSKETVGQHQPNQPLHDQDILVVSIRAIQMYAKRKKHATYLFRRQPQSPHLRRAIADSDLDQYFEPPKDPSLDTLLTLEELKEYADCLPTFDRDAAETLPQHTKFDHEIKLKPGTEPPNHRPRPFSGKQFEAIQKYCEENEARGFIERSSSPARNNLLIVAKPGGGIRVCVDFRDLNNATIKDRHPIPFFRETLAQLNKATVFSKFDVIHAFHRIRMKPGSEWLTAFSTRLGTYQYKVMPFGLCNAPATFQRAINDALFDYLDKFCTAYLDDVLVYSKSLSEHKQHVRLVLKRLKDRGFYVDPKKSEFHKSSVKFLGMFITTEGIRMDPEKVQAIQDWQMPTTAPEVLSFLGFTGFYRQFIRGYSSLALPLTNSVKSKVLQIPSKKDPTIIRRKVQYDKFNPTEEHYKAFADLKAAFQQDIVLQHFNPQEPLHVFTDASGWASGGVLKQRNPQGHLQPVAFFSKKHSPAECNYDIYDLELLAIIRAFEEWEPELIGSDQPIQVITDHKNLETFMKTKRLNRRQARWSLFLSQFNFQIQYAPGATNGEADALSRRPQDIPTDTTDQRLTDNHCILLGPKNLAPGLAPALATTIRCLTISADPDKPDYATPDALESVTLRATNTASPAPDSDADDSDHEDLIDNIDGALPEDLPTYEEDTRSTEQMLDDAYQSDPAAQKIFSALEQGLTRLPDWFRKNSYHFSLADCTVIGHGLSKRIILNGTRLYIPPDARLRRRIFDLVHDHQISGHKGTRATFYLMFPRYYWPFMAQSIKKYCQSCDTCKRASAPRDGYNGYLRPLQIPNARWTDISVDYIQDLPPSKFLGQTYRNILVVVDRLTKRRHFFPSVGRTAQEFAHHFMHIFRLHGLPRSIVSDRGTSFVNAFWKHVCRRLRINAKLSTAAHPQTDGQTEIANQALEIYLRKYINYTQDNWAQWLYLAEFQANDTVNSSTGLTPFFADLGYHPRSGIHPADEYPNPSNLSAQAKDQIMRADEILDQHAALVEYLKIQLNWAQQEHQQQANAHRQQAPKYAVGDKVWILTRNWSTDRLSKKLDNKNAGPYEITRVMHNGSAYELQLPTNMIAKGIFPVFHPSLLRKTAPAKLPDQPPSALQPVIVTDDNNVPSEEWYLDEIVNCKRNNGNWYYQVKWQHDPNPT